MDTQLTSSPSDAGSGMAPASLLFALLAAGIGALAWGAISFFTGYEVGYVAWGVGGIVGLATVRFGGRGAVSATTAAVLTVAGIAGGKLLGTRFVVEKELREQCEQTFTRELYAEIGTDAADFEPVGSDAGEDDLRQFMVEHHYTSAASPEDVGEEELQAFLAVSAPNLEAFAADRPSFDEWYAHGTAESRRAFDEDFSIVQANLDGLSPIDLLFVVLGVSTAFGIVRRAGAPVPAAPGAAGPAAAEDQQSRRAA